MSGPIGSSQWMYSTGAASVFSHTIDQSLRFNRGDNPKLALDPTGSATSSTKCTISFWFKLSKLDTSQYLFTGETGNVAYDVIHFHSTNKIQVLMQNPNSYGLRTTAVFRDVGAWYHLVLECDSTLSTAADRFKLYINGNQQTMTSVYGNYPQDHNWYWSRSGASQNVGASENYGNSFEGYLAEFNFVDGQALDPTSFGETSDGVWVPKQYSGSYGNNGFHLTFADSSAIGDDLSGNTNDFTASNLVASDVVPDSPTNNFATMNLLMIGDARVHSSAAYSEGNLKVAGGGFSTSTIGGGYSTIAIPKDKKIYIEVCETGIDGNYWAAGILIDHHVQNSTQVSGDGAISAYNRQVYVNGVETDYGSSAGLGGLGVTRMSAGDVLGVAVDGATGKVWFHLNGTYFKSPSTNDSGTTGNPSAGTNEIGTVNNTASNNPSGEIFFFINNHGSSDNCIVNFGQDSTFAGSKSAGSETDSEGIGTFQYAVPTDYVSLCAANLTTPTIGPGQDDQADDYFSTVLYTGTGSSQSITGVGFQPDFVWIKGRAARRHMLFDVIRGVTQRLISDDTNIEAVSSDTLTSFDSDGFTEGGNLNTGNNTELYVSWNWKAGGTGVSNGNGSIASTVSASTEAGFSIVTWTGNGTDGATVGHGLTSPELSFVKNRDATTNWDVCWTGFSSRSVTSLNLDTTNDEFSPTQGYQTLGASTITLNNGGSGITRVNTNTQDYVAYVFKSVPGYSAIGLYVGNGSSDGTFVYTGFSVKWLIVKSLDTSNRWILFDVARSPINPIEEKHELNPDDNSAEGTSGTDCFDFLSNGFKLRRTGNVFNTSGHDYLYFAIGEAPFKFSNAR